VQAVCSAVGHTRCAQHTHRYIFSAEGADGKLKHLSAALPSGCRHAVQVLAPMAAVVPVLTLEQHHQDNHKPAS
jgi:hypothetical protein